MFLKNREEDPDKKSELHQALMDVKDKKELKPAPPPSRRGVTKYG